MTVSVLKNCQGVKRVWLSLCGFEKKGEVCVCVCVCVSLVDDVVG